MGIMRKEKHKSEAKKITGKNIGGERGGTHRGLQCNTTLQYTYLSSRVCARLIGDLGGDAEGVSQLCLARAELPKHLCDGHALNAAPKQAVQLRGSRAAAKHLPPSLAHLQCGHEPIAATQLGCHLQCQPNQVRKNC